MTAESYQKFYDNEYRVIYSKGKGANKELSWQDQVSKGSDIYRYIGQRVEFQGNVYEIGCGMGGILKVFQESGYDVVGVDYGSEHIEYGRAKLGVQRLFVGGVEKLLEFDKQAGLLILNHILEHIVDLEDFLLKLHDTITPGGYLYVAVPGMMYSHRRRGDFLMYLQNAHTFYFTLATLRYVLECVGFELVAGDESIVALFRKVDILRDKTDVPQGERMRSFNYLKRMELLRQLGYKKYLRWGKSLKSFLASVLRRTNKTSQSEAM